VILGYRITPPARKHLDDIADYSLHQWGAAQRTTYMRALRKRFEWLAANPELGRVRPEIAPRLRCYREGEHLIFYLPMEGFIAIIGVLHQAMDVDTYFRS